MASEASSHALSARPPTPVSNLSEESYESYQDFIAFKYYPPPHLFRVVKRLSDHFRRGVFLCLPRELPPPFVPETNIDHDLRGLHLTEHSAFEKIPDQRTHQQMWLLEYPRVADTLFHCITQNGVSELKQKHLKRLPQLVVVKMGENIRADSEGIEKVLRGEFASLHVGSFINESQFTHNVDSSWLSLRPMFGPNLSQFCETIRTVPMWFVAHIAIGLTEALEFLHNGGIVYNRMDISTIMLNLYPAEMHYRYRGYPDIQLINFSKAGPLDEAGVHKDANDLANTVEKMIREWSDMATFLVPREEGDEYDERMYDNMTLLRWFQRDNPGYSLEDLKREFGEKTLQERNWGPETFPRDMLKFLHADLATEQEMDHAMRTPTVLKFTEKKEEMRRIVQNEPVEMGSGENAGMKTKRTLVMRFTIRKKAFVRTVRAQYAQEMGPTFKSPSDADWESDDVEMYDADAEQSDLDSLFEDDM